MKDLSYSQEALTNTIPTLFGQFWDDKSIYLSGLLLLCFVIGGIWRQVEIASSDSPKTFPLFSFGSHLIIVVILINVSGSLILSLVSTSNTIADWFITDMGLFINEYLSNDLNELNDVSWWRLSVRKFIAVITGTLAVVAIYIINYLRFFLLAIFFLCAPLCYCLSLIPLFGTKFIFNFFVNVVQVSSWVIFIAIISKIMVEIDFQVESVDSLSYICLSCLFVILTVFIPKVAQMIMGGADVSFISAATWLQTMRLIQKGAELAWKRLGPSPGVPLNLAEKVLKAGWNMTGGKAQDYLQSKKPKQWQYM